MACFEVLADRICCIESMKRREHWCPSCLAVVVEVVPIPDDDAAPREEL